MSRVTNLNRYPGRYLEYANKIEDGANEIVLGPVPAKAAAANLRLDLYSFRSALEASEYANEYPRFQAVRMFVSQRSPWVLTLRHANAAAAVKMKAK